MPVPVLEVSDLRVIQRRPDGERTLVSGVDLQVAAGESLAIVGESGSGKSLTARSVMGLLPRGLEAHGSVRLRGEEILGCGERRMRSLRGGEIGLMMQDPFTILNPLIPCGEQIVEGLRIDGRRAPRRARRAEAVRRLAEIGIDDPSVAGRYPFQLSGGMRQRVAIAAALARDPKILIADEPSTALDVTTQREILELLADLRRSREMALIMITHDLRVAFSVCSQVTVMYAGRILESGPAATVSTTPRHPYTRGLLLSEPPLDATLARLPTVAGSVPEPDDVASRCAFADRCAWVTEPCRASRPQMRPVADDRRSACARLDQIVGELTLRRNDAVAPASVPSAAGDREPLLDAVGVERTFATPRGPVHALRGVEVQVAPGEAIGIVGESGSGKTTLGRCLVGLDAPTAGTIRVDGEPVTDRDGLTPTERLRLRHRVQMVFQDPYSSLNPRRTIGATLGEALEIARNADRTVDELLELVGLPPEYARRLPAALSGGERQRVAIARALAVDPDVLVCDEAVSALDLSVQAQVLNLLNTLRRELDLSVVFITHDLAVARQVASRLYVMHRGEVVEHADVDTVLDAPSHPYTKRLIGSIPRAPRSTDDGPHSAPDAAARFG